MFCEGKMIVTSKEIYDRLEHLKQTMFNDVDNIEAKEKLKKFEDKKWQSL